MTMAIMFVLFLQWVIVTSTAAYIGVGMHPKRAIVHCRFSSVCRMMTKFYQHVLTLAFAVKEINEDLHLLPNVTLGFHIYDSYYIDLMAYRTVLDLLSKSHRFLPNYECGMKKNLKAVIGGLGSDISYRIAELLESHKIPQVRSYPGCG